MAFPREFLQGSPVEAAQKLLGAYFTWNEVTICITELEAYGTHPEHSWPDPASHCYGGLTSRNQAMYGEAGHLYTYLSYGIHICGNISTGPSGIGCGVLLRAGKIIEGIELAQARRKRLGPADKLASGPGCLGQVLALTLHDSGSDLGICLESGKPVEIASGPRIGITKNTDAPWRFWIPHEASVSKYRGKSR